MPNPSVQTFELRVPRPAHLPPAEIWAFVEAALLAVDPRPPLRWAIVAVESTAWVVAGARLC